MKNIKIENKRYGYRIILGLISYFSIFIYGVLFSFQNRGILTNTQIIFDWFSASIVYFFIGASIGAIIDYKISKKDFPLFSKLMLLFWVLIIMVALFLDFPSFISLLFFPLFYGIFFTGAFYTLIPDSFNFILTQLIFSISFFFLFTYWLYLHIKREKDYIQKLILYVLFAILYFGAIKSLLIFS